MEDRRFQKTVEDFICENCGHEVKGSGYTNHCPKCLWGKHVDINPGDRQSKCGGLMKPIFVELTGDQYKIIHHCQTCGFKRKNKTHPDDDFDKIITLSSS